VDDDETTILVCMAIAVQPEPGAPSIMTNCCECLQPVWRSESSLQIVEPVVTMCVACAVARAAEAGEYTVEPMPDPIRASLLAEGWTMEETEDVDRAAADYMRWMARE
jgi:hypothetical protein